MLYIYHTFLDNLRGHNKLIILDKSHAPSSWINDINDILA